MQTVTAVHFPDFHKRARHFFLEERQGRRQNDGVKKEKTCEKKAKNTGHTEPEKTKNEGNQKPHKAKGSVPVIYTHISPQKRAEDSATVQRQGGKKIYKAKHEIHVFGGCVSKK